MYFRLSEAVEECQVIVEGIFEICEYASTFNDCMHMKMEHILDRIMMERRMESLGQMSNSEYTIDDDFIKLTRDEL